MVGWWSQCVRANMVDCYNNTAWPVLLDASHIHKFFTIFHLLCSASCPVVSCPVTDKQRNRQPEAGRHPLSCGGLCQQLPHAWL